MSSFIGTKVHIRNGYIVGGVGDSSGSNASAGIFVSLEEWEALGDSRFNNNIDYYIPSDEIDPLKYGIVVDVLYTNWTLQNDGTYTNEVEVSALDGDEVLDINLYGSDITSDQAKAFDELVSYVDIQPGKLVLVAEEEITVSFQLIVRGVTDTLKDTVIYVKDMSLMDGMLIPVSASDWVVQDDGTYKQSIAITELDGNELLDVSLYGDVTETQAEAYDELTTSIDVEKGALVLTASQAITVDYTILLQGKTTFNAGYYVADGNEDEN